MTRRTNKRPELAQTETIAELPMACADDAAALEWLEAKRWGKSPCCPHCGSVNVYTMKMRDGSRNKNGRWRCRDCGQMYSVRTGTIMEESLIPLHKWCRAFWESASCKNGVSALELSRKLQVNYRTALFLTHRLRWAMTDDAPPKLGGTVEADTTPVGGKPRHRGWKKGRDWQPRPKYTSKTPVFAVVQRGGAVRAQVMANVTADNLRIALQENVSPNARLMTDDAWVYRGTAPLFRSHESVNHTAGEYVRGDAHTNTIEGFFSRLKRGLNGTYHAVSKAHLSRYVAEFEYRYNTRDLNDGDRTLHLVRRAEGKRLMYRDPITRAS